jgi:hypothetical protein
MGGSIFTPEPIQDLDFRRGTESDVDGMTDAHRESILQLGSQYDAPAIVNEWAGVVNRGLYLEAIGLGEILAVVGVFGVLAYSVQQRARVRRADRAQGNRVQRSAAGGYKRRPRDRDRHRRRPDRRRHEPIDLDIPLRRATA